MSDERRGTLHERATWALSMVVVVLLAVVGALALGVAAFSMLFVWWPLAVAVTGLGVIGCVWRLRVTRGRSPKIGWTAATLLTVALSAFIVALVPGIVRHDRIMDEVSATICGPPLVPSGAVVRSCEAHGPENPSNGNSCGYFVELRLETTSLTPSGVRAFYGSIWLPRDLIGLTMTSPYIDQERRSGLMHVSVLAVGDPGADPRCN